VAVRVKYVIVSLKPVEINFTADVRVYSQGVSVQVIAWNRSGLSINVVGRAKRSWPYRECQMTRDVWRAGSFIAWHARRAPWKLDIYYKRVGRLASGHKLPYISCRRPSSCLRRST